MSTELKVIGNGTVGSTSGRTVMDYMPEGTTSEQLTAIDDGRSQFAADVTTVAGEIAQQYFTSAEGKDANGFTVPSVDMGGNTTLDINIATDYHATVAITTAHAECLDVAIKSISALTAE